MSYDDDGPEEEGADDNVSYLDLPEPPRRPASKTTQRNAKRDQGRKLIPHLPPPDVNVNDIDMQGDVTTLDAAVVSMRIAGASFHDIAMTLELPSAMDAQSRLYKAIAKTHPREEWETTRQLEVARVEVLVARSMAMAGADYLVDEDGVKHENAERLKWHAQAAQDIALHATITGAKAPTRVEITPTDEEYGQIVDLVLREKGVVQDREYSILELTELDEIEDAEIVEEGEDGQR